jgi:hypothetical protein
MTRLARVRQGLVKKNMRCECSRHGCTPRLQGCMRKSESSLTNRHPLYTEMRATHTSGRKFRLENPLRRPDSDTDARAALQAARLCSHRICQEKLPGKASETRACMFWSMLLKLVSAWSLKKGINTAATIHLLLARQVAASCGMHSLEIVSQDHGNISAVPHCRTAKKRVGCVHANDPVTVRVLAQVFANIPVSKQVHMEIGQESL